MVNRIVDEAFDNYIEEYESEYEPIVNGNDFGDFVDFISHDFLFCSILHGKSGNYYDIRQNDIDKFKNLLGDNDEAYSIILDIVKNYFKENPDDTCEKIFEYNCDTLLKYYTYVFTKKNEDLFVLRNCPSCLKDDDDTDDEDHDN